MDRLGRLTDRLLPVVLTMAAAILLFTQLDHPARIVFDEVYYVNDARSFLVNAVEDGFAVHPPVGKWLIATGIWLFGDNSFGWRAAGSIAGALGVLLTYLIGLRLFRRQGPAALAALLLMTDGLWFVQSRTSMLDIFLGMFVALTAYLLLVDHDRAGMDAASPRYGTPMRIPSGASIGAPIGASTVATPDATEDADTDPGVDPDTIVAQLEAAAAQQRRRLPARALLPVRHHGARYLAGVSLGLAMATKWSGLLAWGAAGLLSLGWEIALRRRLTGRPFAAMGRPVVSIGLALVLVPALTYGLTFVPWLVNYRETYEASDECPVEPTEPCDLSLSDRLGGLVRYHEAVWRFHDTLTADHPYRAPAYTWPVMARPVVYYYENCVGDRAAGVQTPNDDGELVAPEPCLVGETEASEIIALGNPALWYGFIAAALLLAGALMRGDRRAWFLFVFWGAQFLPWLVVSRPVFFFYMTPVVPFLALTVAFAAVWIGERRHLVGLALGAVLGAAAGYGIGLALVAATGDGTAGAGQWIGLGAGELIGGALGALVDRRSDPTQADTGARWGGLGNGVWIGVAVAVAAVALFVYFYPVWSGVPLPDDAIRQRWWIRPGWI